MKKQMGLRKRLIIYFSVCVTFTVLGLSDANYRIEIRRARATLDRSSEEALLRLKGSLSFALWNMEADRVQLAIETELRDPSIAAVGLKRRRVLRS